MMCDWQDLVSCGDLPLSVGLNGPLIKLLLNAPRLTGRTTKRQQLISLMCNVGKKLYILLNYFGRIGMERKKQKRES